MRKNKNKPKGFIAIVSILIVTTISMIFAMTILKSGVNNANLSLNSIYYENARINVNLCLEDVLYRIKLEEQFNRDLDYTITDEDSCTTDIQWFAPTQYDTGITEALVLLEITGVSGSFSRTYNYGLKVRRHDINHTDGTVQYMNNVIINYIEELNS
ncbi:hypothetical protein JW758_01820 [Candidatus Peregrinibacteria bacterium]|nr:hypothetical protein [Candidatus Peregrinibacteria bacterium]